MRIERKLRGLASIVLLAFTAMSSDVYGVDASTINWGWNAYPPTFPNEAYGPLTDVDPDNIGDNQLFDVWCPDGAGPFPCYIYAHGGSFIGSSKKAYHHAGKYLPDDGVVFMNINYRLDGNYLTGVADGLAMVQYVKANAAKYKIDPEKIFLGGNSAGGIIMSEIIYTHQEPGIMGLWSLNPWFQNDYSTARLAAYPIPVVQVAYDLYPANGTHSALLAFTHASDNWSLGLPGLFMGGGNGDYTYGYEETYDYNPQIWRDGAWIKNTQGVDTGEAVPTLGEWINDIAGGTTPPVEDLEPPTPNPASFSIAPNATSDMTINMRAAPGIDASGLVEYRFIETSGNPGGSSSPWQAVRVYNDNGLTPGTEYSYQVQMRDAFGNVGTASAVSSATTEGTPPVEDLDPPTPNPASFSIAPNAISHTAITMTAATGSDASGVVEYRFVELSGNPGADNSNWQTDPTYTDSGLAPETEYRYRVRMRDAFGNLGTTSTVVSATTEAAGITWNMDSAAEVLLKNITATFSGGILDGQNSGNLNDPLCTLKEDGSTALSVNADENTILNMSVYLGANIPSAPFVIKFWKGSALTTVNLPGNAVAGWHTYSVDLTQYPEWNGTVTKFRLDFVEGSGVQYDIMIDYVSLERAAE